MTTALFLVQAIGLVVAVGAVFWLAARLNRTEKQRGELELSLFSARQALEQKARDIERRDEFIAEVERELDWAYEELDDGDRSRASVVAIRRLLSPPKASDGDGDKGVPGVRSANR